jgi:YHS domain-containing protein
MKTSTLFVVGLVLGALCVFAVRGIAISGDAAPAGGGAAADRASPHGGHAQDAAPAPMPAPAPAPVPAPAPAPAPEHAGHAAPVPENLICPVMGNEVDPEVFVEYEGRVIGFCCAGCDAKFLEDPEKYLKKVDAELAARKGAK